MPSIGISRENTIMSRKSLSILLSPSKSTLSNGYSLSPYPTPKHTFSETMMEENMEIAHSIITKWDLNSPSDTNLASLFTHDRREALEFLKSVAGLRRAMHFLVHANSGSEKLVLAQKLMQTAMTRLEKEFYLILSSIRDRIDPESVSSLSSGGSNGFENDSDDESKALSGLKSIADCMISSGYGRECMMIYKLMRKSIVDEGLYRLGIDRFKLSTLQKMNWKAVDHMIKKWLKAAKIAMEKLFRTERMFCDHVFSASRTIRESCFYEITKAGAINLFRFPQFVMKTRRSQEKIYALLELYQEVYQLWPDIQTIFDYESTSDVIVQALTSLVKLGDSIQSILFEFKSKIQNESSKILVPGGVIHPLTESAMTFISSLTDYSTVLSRIIADHTQKTYSPLPESYFEFPRTADVSKSEMALFVARVILVLLCKLDSKSELYRDAALSYLFLANNLNYVVDRVTSSDLKDLLGEEWIIRHAEKVKQYASSCEAIAWNKVLLALPKSKSGALSTDAVKECFEKFSAAFEESYRKQTSWVIPDKKLREDMKFSIARKLVPAYAEFCEAYSDAIKGENNLETLVWLGPDDLGNYLSDLYHGTAVSGSSSSSSSSSSSLASLRGCLPR